MPKIIKRFSDEQIDRANRIDVVEYARSTGLEIARSGNWFKAKHMSGLYFNKNANTWHWETQDVGGTGAISLCMKLENLEWKDAVKRLLGEEMETMRHSEQWTPVEEPKMEFRLPDKADNYRHVFAYLCKSRGIDKEIVGMAVKQGLLYENTQHSCVFVGKDAEGIPRHASVRSTYTQGKVFKQDVPGSQKQYSFSISGTSGVLNVFEAPIDLLSYMSLQKTHGLEINDSYISLAGTTTKALECYLSQHDHIEKIRVCTDNDSYINNPNEEFSSNSIHTIKIQPPKLVAEKNQLFEDKIIFKTYKDFEKYVEHNAEAQNYYVAFDRAKVELNVRNPNLNTEDAFHNVVIKGNESFLVADSLDNLKIGKGMMINAEELFKNYFFVMPAGEACAARIYNCYKEEYQVTRHRPKSKDFNEDLVHYRQQEQIKEQPIQENLNERLEAAADRVMEQASIPEPDLEMVM